MSKYTLLALDMDGTVLDEDQNISSETADAIRAARDAGIIVMFSTGRAFQNAQPYAEELGLESPMVTVNGSEVWKNPHELLVRHLLDRDTVRKMVELSEKHDAWFWAYSTERQYNRENWDADIDAEEWLKFGYFTEDDNVREQLWKELGAMGGLELTNSSPHNIEINPIGISKASGIQTVCDLLGFTMSQVVAVGDSLNDLAVIRAAGLGVAMGNAQDEVKNAADVVVRSNNEHGVAQVIREYLL
ncbi:Cof-type HAD-IIB family hydrolase [Paenibacillus apiarius]|uniref:Cof-type HAD-IIB family hydrolase n=1 Tax=Paenibacillus apiarius TaxID=46240 RepID=A0ABT4E3D5_9BACL|nr:Cof-type HAD-IIB family hydrolase [Paenibacillus apiarius]MCY9512698.1 Cof-type HAD-IIB family hydrolase [Paenibacillus apiarius]MCY9523038.1 Cof-type HAD-IIB family hydrolase [Paenibacillus apiarius]MCY9550700.1 Cof-type HAD-IIB family hydrolase [Paenibacillus apiarius]MCY9556524.1 Cof-type HAD-IIB family hydrolase [Paenibacillus apiarius]MCY9682939.1 Cof-type HAD-IIB family hydrolase [Paenibacillus apiarius]